MQHIIDDIIQPRFSRIRDHNYTYKQRRKLNMFKSTNTLMNR